MLTDCEGRWFAIQVRPKTECAAMAGLQSRGYETYLPTYYSKRQWSDRVKTLKLPLFTGYLFCKFTAAASGPIITTLGVIRILGNGSVPVPVLDAEVASLKNIETATGVRPYPWPTLKAGDEVCVSVGPLRGLIGVLLCVKNTSTLVVSVPLLRRAIAVAMDKEWVTPVHTRGFQRRLDGGDISLS
ncbi:MAG: transcription termination/antitermination NusG family protein [Candidatus Sulfotelmatobacter sp.]